MKTKPNVWEPVCEREKDYLDRMPVPGGWIYRTLVRNDEPPFAPTVAMVFVPLSADVP